MDAKTRVPNVPSNSWMCWLRLSRLFVMIFVGLPVWYFSARSYCGNAGSVAKTLVCDVDKGCPANGRNCAKDLNVTRKISVELDDEALIQSPEFPRAYPPNLNMMWNVSTAPGHRIRVVFYVFDLEESADCKMDYLTLHDGADLHSPVLGTFCGHHEASLPEPITSKSNSLVLHFKTDKILCWKGFQLTLSTDPRTNARHADQGFRKTTTTESSPVVRNVPVKLEDDAVIQSPNFPRDYPPNLNMLWDVTAAPGHRIRVVFRVLELEDSTDCRMDFLTLHDGADLYSPVLGTFCRHGESSLQQPITSSSNSMVLRFRTDSTISWKGFELALSTVCGRTLLAQASENVLISQPKYGPDGYTSNLTCDWIIESSPERNVQVSFDLEKPSLENDNERRSKNIAVSGCENSISGDCVQYSKSEDDGDKDYVEIFDGPDESSTRIGRYFANRMPPTITSGAEKLLVRFSSGGGRRHYQGFKAVYKEV